MREARPGSGNGGGLATVALYAVLAAVLVAAAGAGTFYAAEQGWLNELKDTNEPTDLNQTAVEDAVHERVNAERTDRGFDALAYDEELRGIARGHSQDMIERNFFAHTNPDGDQPIDRYDDAEYDCELGPDRRIASENIGQVRWSGTSLTADDVADRVVTGWLESRDHRENMFNDTWDREGIGMWANETTVMVTQNFC